MYIQVDETPNPETLKFIPGINLINGRPLEFLRIEDTESSPLAKKLLDLPYIAQVNIAGQVVTLTGDNIESWPAVGKEIGGVIREQINSGEASVTEKAMDAGNSALFDQVNTLIQNDVNPSIASHGGVIRRLSEIIVSLNCERV